MYDLYRFMNKERAESFLRGNLYMSSLGHFWPPFPRTRDDSKEPDGRLDTFEGTVFAQRPESSPLPKDLQAVLRGDLHYLLESSQYVNLLCMVQHFYNPYNKTMRRLDERMRGWGDYAVRIYDVGVFLGRLQDYAMKQGDDYFLSGPIEYLDSFSDKPQTDCFNKLSAFSFQNEWRIAYLSDLKGKQDLVRHRNPNMSPYDEALQISIGPLDDIADIIPSDVIFNDLESAYNGLKVVEDEAFEPAPAPSEAGSAAFYDNLYYGWGDRETFQDQIVSIDAGKVTMRFLI